MRTKIAKLMMSELEQLKAFKNKVQSLKTKFGSYLEEQARLSKTSDRTGEDTQQISMQYTIPGVLNKQRPDIAGFLDISENFQETLTEKNRLYSEILAKKNFTGSKTKAETELKISMLKAKIAQQNSVLQKIGFNRESS